MWSATPTTRPTYCCCPWLWVQHQSVFSAKHAGTGCTCCDAGFDYQDSCATQVSINQFAQTIVGNSVHMYDASPADFLVHLSICRHMCVILSVHMHGPAFHAFETPFKYADHKLSEPALLHALHPSMPCTQCYCKHRAACVVDSAMFVRLSIT